MTDKPLLLDETIDDKWRFVQNADGSTAIYRYGELSKIMSDNLHLAMAQEIERLRDRLDRALSE